MDRRIVPIFACHFILCLPEHRSQIAIEWLSGCDSIESVPLGVRYETRFHLDGRQLVSYRRVTAGRPRLARNAKIWRPTLDSSLGDLRSFQTKAMSTSTSVRSRTRANVLRPQRLRSSRLKSTGRELMGPAPPVQSRVPSRPCQRLDEREI